MDKNTLNEQIILCRAGVRKARVIVIRKIVKKLKILKSCKKEEMKGKRLKKAERLFEIVQIIKKAKVDDVTKFALRNPDLEKYLTGSKVNIKERALAHLAKQDAVLKKVNQIREKIPNWEVELPLLLDSVLKKKKKVKELSKKEGEKGENKKGEGKADFPKQRKFEKVKPKESEIVEVVKIKKVEDPFFMGKKMIAPSRLLDNSKKEGGGKAKRESEQFNQDRRSSFFNVKPFKVKQGCGGEGESHTMESNDKLHPSWAAKKVKLIQPFQGKIIKFSEE